MGTKRWFLLLLVLVVSTHHALANGGGSSSEEQDCDEQCENGCYGPGNGECCHEQCHHGCTDSTDMGCMECRNVKLDGRCQVSCPPPFIYNTETFEMEPNPDFKFQYGQECVESCPKFAFVEGTQCVDHCSQGYRPEGDRCIRCGGACPVKGEMNPLVSDQCDGVKQYQWGVISRKHRPTNNATCTQVLIGPPRSTLKLQLHDVEIHDDIDEKLVLGADGYRQSFDRETVGTTLELQTNAMVIQHRTLAAGHGYILRYNFIPPENEEGNSNCDEVFTSHTGTFQSPGYPSKYRPRERCTYQILVDPGYKVSVTFRRLYLQGDEPSCLADKMEVIEPILGTSQTYCGRHRPPFTINSETNYLVLKFTSDNTRNYKGYQADFSAVEVPGGGQDITIDAGNDLPPLI